MDSRRSSISKPYIRTVGLYSKSSNNDESMIKERKEICRYKAKDRRMKEKSEFDNLVSALPITCPNEKNLNLQISIGYLLARKIFQNSRHLARNKIYAKRAKKYEHERKRLKAQFNSFLQVANEQTYESSQTKNSHFRPPAPDIRKESKLFSNILASGVNGVMISFVMTGPSAGRIVYISDNIYEFIGQESKNLIGKYVFDLFHTADLNYFLKSIGFKYYLSVDKNVEDWTAQTQPEPNTSNLLKRPRHFAGKSDTTNSTDGNSSYNSNDIYFTKFKKSLLNVKSFKNVNLRVHNKFQEPSNTNNVSDSKASSKGHHPSNLGHFSDFPAGVTSASLIGTSSLICGVSSITKEDSDNRNAAYLNENWTHYKFCAKDDNSHKNDQFYTLPQISPLATGKFLTVSLAGSVFTYRQSSQNKKRKLSNPEASTSSKKSTSSNSDLQLENEEFCFCYMIELGNPVFNKNKPKLPVYEKRFMILIKTDLNLTVAEVVSNFDHDTIREKLPPNCFKSKPKVGSSLFDLVKFSGYDQLTKLQHDCLRIGYSESPIDLKFSFDSTDSYNFECHLYKKSESDDLWPDYSVFQSSSSNKNNEKRNQDKFLVSLEKFHRANKIDQLKNFGILFVGKMVFEDLKVQQIFNGIKPCFEKNKFQQVKQTVETPIPIHNQKLKPTINFDAAKAQSQILRNNIENNTSVPTQDLILRNYQNVYPDNSPEYFNLFSHSTSGINPDFQTIPSINPPIKPQTQSISPELHADLKNIHLNNQTLQNNFGNGWSLNPNNENQLDYFFHDQKIKNSQLIGDLENTMNKIGNNCQQNSFANAYNFDNLAEKTYIHTYISRAPRGDDLPSLSLRHLPSSRR